MTDHQMTICRDETCFSCGHAETYSQLTVTEGYPPRLTGTGCRNCERFSDLPTTVLTEHLLGTLQDPEGAGSDLDSVGVYNARSGTIYVNGELDIGQLVRELTEIFNTVKGYTYD